MTIYNNPIGYNSSINYNGEVVVCDNPIAYNEPILYDFAGNYNCPEIPSVFPTTIAGGGYVIHDYHRKIPQEDEIGLILAIMELDDS